MRTLHLSPENVPRCIPERGNCSYAPLQLDSYSKNPAATVTPLRIHPLYKAPAATSSPLYIHSYYQTPAARVRRGRPDPDFGPDPVGTGIPNTNSVGIGTERGPVRDEKSQSRRTLPAATPTPRQIYLFSDARCNSFSSLPIPLRPHPGRLATLLQIQFVLRTQLRSCSCPSRVQPLIPTLQCDSSASIVLRMGCAALSAHAHFGAHQLHAPRIAGGR